MGAPIKQFTEPNYGLYESMKAHWVDQHPDATPAEYQAAMQRIAAECGV